jgi:hypothetical protein
MINGTRSWLWWLGGLLCAFVFSSEAPAAVAAKRYGVRPFPRPAPPPPVTPTRVTEEQKKRAGKLIDEYMAGRSGGAPTEKEKAEIAKLVKDLGAAEFAVREAASRGVLKYGGKALPQLREALKDRDPEVVQRAEAAIKAIQSGGNGRVVTQLRAMYSAAVTVIRQRQAKWRKAAYVAELQAVALEGQKRAEAARAKRAEMAAAKKKRADLELLVRQLTVRKMYDRRRGPQPAYGVRWRK